ncbi:MAG: hypothetical protein CMH57_08170 [Myxococcales bacterium]|nr:hypothetical protein [Myxococcales bacterium]
MSHTFTFHYSAGPGGPRVMAIVDLEASCGTCGYTEIQRFYHGLPYHPLTLPRFKQHIQASPDLLGYDCSNCGDPVTPTHTTRGAWTFGFPDGEGIIQAFFTCRFGEPEGLHYVLDPRTTLDPQALPIWGRDDVARRSEKLERLDDDAIFERFGRVFTVKHAWRLLWEEHQGSGELVMEEAAPGCWLLMGDDRADALAWARGELGDTFDRLLAAEINAPPERLTRALPGPIPGRYIQWMQQEASRAIDAGTCCAIALLDPTVALKRLSATLRRGRLTFELDEDEHGGPLLREITTPRGDTHPQEILVSHVLKYAAHTGMTPGDAARYAAEVLIGELMGLEVR